MMSSHDAFLDAWAAAERDGDAAATDRLLTDDFVGIGPVGFVLDKAAWLRRHDDGLSYDSLGLDEIASRFYGETAVTTARWNAHGSSHGHPIPEATRATLVAVGGDDAWRLATIQFSFIAGTPGAPGPPGGPS
jgi:ketosteroid isomerase-like protein